MSKKFLDKDIYNRATKLADEKYKSNSAYKSMYMVEQYEILGGRINSEQKSNPSICRPTKKVNKDTTSLAQSFTKKQIKKALEIKKKGRRIDWDKL